MGNTEGGRFQFGVEDLGQQRAFQQFSPTVGGGVQALCQIKVTSLFLSPTVAQKQKENQLCVEGTWKHLVSLQNGLTYLFIYYLVRHQDVGMRRDEL